MDKQPTPASVEEYDWNKLYEWVMDENRKKAQTYFTASPARNVASAVELQFSQLQSQLLQAQTEVKELKEEIDLQERVAFEKNDELTTKEKECEYWKALAEAAGKVLGYVPTYGQLNVPFARIDGFLEDRKVYDKLKNQKQIT